MRNGPDLWDAILADVQAPIFGGVYAGNVIAGGCIRDFLLGIEPKDIDIWVNERDFSNFEAQMSHLNRESEAWDVYSMEPEAEHTEYEDWKAGRILTPYEGTYTDPDGREWQVNIIACSDHAQGITTLVEGFDMDICQFWFSGGMIHRTPAADAALQARTATVLREETQARSDVRFARFAARNPGVLKYVNPFQGSLDLA